MLDPDGITTLTFDCYGTLVDWEAGAIRAIRPLLERHGVTLSDDETIAVMGEIEHRFTVPPYRSYRSILTSVIEGFGERYGFPVTAADRDVLAASVPAWTAFPDTADALRALASRYKLAVISNIDDDLFAATAKHLPDVFTDVITAEQARSYKPDIGIFETALGRLGVKGSEVAHIAEGAGEVVPARKLGCATVWIRRNGRSAGSLIEEPDDQYHDLRSLVERLGLGK